MPQSTSSVRSLGRELASQFAVRAGEDPDDAMRRIDRVSADAVRAHLFGGLLGRRTAGRRSALGAVGATR